MLIIEDGSGVLLVNEEDRTFNNYYLNSLSAHYDGIKSWFSDLISNKSSTRSIIDIRAMIMNYPE